MVFFSFTERYFHATPYDLFVGWVLYLVGTVNFNLRAMVKDVRVLTKDGVFYVAVFHATRHLQD